MRTQASKLSFIETLAFLIEYCLLLLYGSFGIFFFCFFFSFSFHTQNMDKFIDIDEC